MHQLTFAIRGFNMTILESLKSQSWKQCNRRATKVLGSQVQALLEVTFLLNLFCSTKAVLIE